MGRYRRRGLAGSRGAAPVDPSRAHRQRVPRPLCSCPQCGAELTKRQLKLALIDRIEQVVPGASPAAVELMRLLFPEDNVTVAEQWAAKLEEQRQRSEYPETSSPRPQSPAVRAPGGKRPTRPGLMPGGQAQRALDAVLAAGAPIAAAEVGRIVGVRRGDARTILMRLVKRGSVERVGTLYRAPARAEQPVAKTGG